MECNKDEAVRAKEISEKKFEAKDYVGAKKFALKAQSLYPGLSELPPMLSVLEVYISAETKVDGESDWYLVLGVSPNADEESIRKKYRKLALVLHPDKNKSVGADGAFKLISEAWNTLSDKVKRALFDQKRHVRVVRPPQVPSNMPNGGASSSSQSTTVPNTVPQKAKPAAKKTKPRTSTTTAPQNNYSITPTFWTVCHRCNLQHEYLRMYLHRNLLCPSCNLPYFSFEYPPPTAQIPKMPPSQPTHFQPSQTGPTVGGSANPFLGPFGDHTNFSPAAQQAYEKFKGESLLNAARREKEADLKRKYSGPKKDVGSSSDANVAKKKKVAENPTGKKTQGAKVSSAEPEKRGRASNPKSSSDFPKFDPKILVERAKVEIVKKVDEWKNSKDVAVSKGVSKKAGKAAENGKTNGLKKGNSNDSGLKSISVPDSDFHDFDKDRIEAVFRENQVWAAYDDDDGMPRFYAIVHEVISKRPFKVKISWLNAKTNTELGPLNWIGSGFTKTCGEFRIGHRVIRESINSFSHKVKSSKGVQGVVLIYPKKGDVWALYRNWSAEWNGLTDMNVVHQYDMVEVIDDYDEKLGVRVIPLVKVAGFKTVFHRHSDEKEMKTVPKEELFRFSHQVPSRLLSGQEGKNAPKGCRELDPAATPLELLQVISEANQEKITRDEMEITGDEKKITGDEMEI